MLYLSFSSVMCQSLRKYQRTNHAASYLSMKTNISFKRINRLNTRRTVKLAKQLGWDPDINWRDYPCKWHLRPAFEQEHCLCESGCHNLPLTFPDGQTPEHVTIEHTQDDARVEVAGDAKRDIDVYPVQPIHPFIHSKDIPWMWVSESK